MKVRKVNRYYCDFCKKANCSKPSIASHEASCTMNPSRVCRMCKFIDEDQANMADLIGALPAVSQLAKNDDILGFQFSSLTDDTMAKLREVAGGCPMCMLAALRQKKIPVYCAIRFDFAAECKSIFSDASENKREW